MLDTILKTFHIIINIIIIVRTNNSSKNYYPHYTDEESERQRLVQVVMKLEFDPRPSDSRIYSLDHHSIIFQLID